LTLDLPIATYSIHFDHLLRLKLSASPIQCLQINMRLQTFLLMLNTIGITLASPVHNQVVEKRTVCHILYDSHTHHILTMMCLLGSSLRKFLHSEVTTTQKIIAKHRHQAACEGACILFYIANPAIGPICPIACRIGCAALGGDRGILDIAGLPGNSTASGFSTINGTLVGPNGEQVYTP
jgi:hypothetical protein